MAIVKREPLWVPTFMPIGNREEWRIVDFNTGTFYKDKTGQSVRFRTAEEARAKIMELNND